MALNLTNLLENNTMTAEMAAYMWSLIDGKAVGIITGVTGSGKTVLLSALASMMNPGWRIMTMEDVLEIQIPHAYSVRLETPNGYMMDGSRRDATDKNLISMSVVHRPDYLMVGNARGTTMGAFLRLAKAGHGGIAIFYETSAERALARLTSRFMKEVETRFW